MLLRANRKHSLKAREREREREWNHRKRNKASVYMKTVSSGWSLYSKGRGDCRLMQQGRGELIKLY